MLQISNSNFSEIDLVGFQYEPVGLGAKEVCFDEEHGILNMGEK